MKKTVWNLTTTKQLSIQTPSIRWKNLIFLHNQLYQGRFNLSKYRVENRELHNRAGGCYLDADVYKYQASTDTENKRPQATNTSKSQSPTQPKTYTQHSSTKKITSEEFFYRKP